MTFYANTKKQPLSQHLFAVGVLAEYIVKSNFDCPNLAKAAYLSGVEHDIGKIDPHFQNWLNKEIKKNEGAEVPEDGQHQDKPIVRHNEISAAIFALCRNYSNIKQNVYDLAHHAIYWHHAKWQRDKKGEEMSLNAILESTELKATFDGQLSLTHNTFDILNAIVSDINTMEFDYFGKATSMPYEHCGLKEKASVPEYKVYESKSELSLYRGMIDNNARRSIVRSALILADRVISSLTSEKLNELINNKSLENLYSQLEKSNLSVDISNSLSWCDLVNKSQITKGAKKEKEINLLRSEKQSEAAKKLSMPLSVGSANINVLEGPAGCGKTKIAIEWAKNVNAKKLIFIVPRVAIAQGLFEELTTSDYGLKSKVEIHTGEFKQYKKNGELCEITNERDYFSGDVVITTIDMMAGALITHRSVATLVHFFDAHIIFDEFHELIKTTGYDLLFAELVKIKQMQNNKNGVSCLLVSATTNPFFCKELLGISHTSVAVSSFNTNVFNLEVLQFDGEKENPFSKAHFKNTICISNNVKDVQHAYMKNEWEIDNPVIFHSKFSKTDKQVQFKKVMSAFGKDSNRDAVLFSGPIVQSSLNISCGWMITELSNAENLLQRMGRLNRFGEIKGATRYTIYAPLKPTLLAKQNILASSKAFIDYLHANRSDLISITIAELYEIYNNFYKDKSCLKAVEKDVLKQLSASAKRLNAKVYDPVVMPKPKKDASKKLPSSSIRDDSRYVNMAVVEHNDGKFIQTNTYLCGDISDVTMSKLEICGYDDSDPEKNLASVYAHQQGSSRAKQSKAWKPIYAAARSPDQAIKVSFVDDERLEQLDSYIYYVRSKKQTVGWMRGLQVTSNQGLEAEIVDEDFDNVD